MLWDVEIISSELEPFVTKEKSKRKKLQWMAAEQSLNFKVRTHFLKGGSKIKTNPLIFLCQVITLREQIQIEIVANGLRQSAADCEGYRCD